MFSTPPALFLFLLILIIISFLIHKADFSFRILFEQLSVANVVRFFMLLVTEQKVCVISEHLDLLTPVQEAMKIFLFPLEWQNPYIPVMPTIMSEVLECPSPFLI